MSSSCLVAELLCYLLCPPVLYLLSCRCYVIHENFCRIPYSRRQFNLSLILKWHVDIVSTTATFLKRKKYLNCIQTIIQITLLKENDNIFNLGFVSWIKLLSDVVYLAKDDSLKTSKRLVSMISCYDSTCQYKEINIL